MMALKDGVLNVGVIGAGRNGVVHLEALSQCATANPIIISNPTVSKAKAAAEKFRLPEHTADAMDVINHPDVEAVWICSPSQFHAEQIMACAKAGKVHCRAPHPARCTPSMLHTQHAAQPARCPSVDQGCRPLLVPCPLLRPILIQPDEPAPVRQHVFCEKPIATDMKETIEAINYCNEKGIKLMTALQRRFDPNFARVKKVGACVCMCVCVGGCR